MSIDNSSNYEEQQPKPEAAGLEIPKGMDISLNYEDRAFFAALGKIADTAMFFLDSDYKAADPNKRELARKAAIQIACSWLDITDDGIRHLDSLADGYLESLSKNDKDT